MLALYATGFFVCAIGAYRVNKVIGSGPMFYSLLGLAFGSLSLALFYFILLVTDIERDMLTAIVLSRILVFVNGLSVINAGLASYVVFTRAIKYRT